MLPVRYGQTYRSHLLSNSAFTGVQFIDAAQYEFVTTSLCSLQARTISRGFPNAYLFCGLGFVSFHYFRHIPQIPHDFTRARTGVAAVASRSLTDRAIPPPKTLVHYMVQELG
jgi:hypothetical protein